MGSLESGIPAKRENGRAARTERQHLFLQRNKSSLSRFFLLKKLDYLQWICTVAVFFFFVVLFQMCLPGLVVDKSDKPPRITEILPPALVDLKEKGCLDFGDDARFEPSNLLMKFQRETKDLNFTSSPSSTTLQRFGFRKPQLALVFADLLADPQQLLMVTIIKALKETGYAIEVYSLEDGPVRGIWQKLGVPVTIFERDQTTNCVVDWLIYDGIIVNSLEARSIFSCFMQEPFRSLPLIWVINEETLALQARQYNSTGQIDLLNDWKKIFNRASVVVFNNYLLPMLYSEFDAGNFYVIPGSPAEAWEVGNLNPSQNNDTVVAIVGSQFLYRGLWLEHALILQALRPLFSDSTSESNENFHLKVIILGRDSASNYSMAIETIALNLTYPKDAVKYINFDGNVDEILGATDLVIYGSFFEEQSFPENLIKAMSVGKPVIAPDLTNIRKYVDDRVNGYLFPKEDIKALTQTVRQVISKRKLSPLARNIALMGRSTAKNLMARETVEGYASLLENVLKFSSEVALPKDVKELPHNLREEWQWHLFEVFLRASNTNRTARSYGFLSKVEEQWGRTPREAMKFGVANDDSFVYEIWKEEKYLQMLNTRKRREEEELKDRAVQYHGTWEEVYKNAKRVDRSKNDLHERDEGELLRTGQLLCIYEPYFGGGTWPFLHQFPLYRGVSLSTKGRRPRTDDVDAPSRLGLLNNPYYRDVLGEYGAFLAISNKIDRLHKNAWIGFQSWRATARKEFLSMTAENALINAMQAQRHGDALYFWVRMDKDARNPLRKDFWSFCDAINAGNCRFAFNETLRKMYGVEHLDSLPPMPEDDGNTWSVMQSWALSTRSFLEFVMFSRMFVDSLDAQIYEEHHQMGRCYLSLTKDRQCYMRVLELLVNVWAYHSARRIIYVEPKTGLMQEQHEQSRRRGTMWVKWFDYGTLKAMDEDLAEEADSDRRAGHWLWPWTGEIVWRGSLEKDRQRRSHEREKRRQRSKDKLIRMRSRSGRQKVIGKYVKLPPEDESPVIGNSTTLTANV